MQVPLQITFDNIERSDALEARLRDEVAKLEKFYGRITSARVVLTRPQRRQHKGDHYQVRIHLAIPGAADVTVNREPAEDTSHEDVYVTVRDAFEAARRQLQDAVRRRGA